MPPIDVRRPRRRPADLRARRPVAAAVAAGAQRRGRDHRRRRLLRPRRAGLLGSRPMSGAPRHTPLMRRTARWLDRRLGAADFARSALNKVFPDHWSFMIGELALYCFIVLIVT